MTAFYTIDEVAQRFRVSRRTMQDLVRLYPFYRLAGRRKLFSEADIGKLYEALPCPSKSSAGTEALTGTSGAPSEASLWTRAQALTTGGRRKRSVSSAKPNSSTVVSLDDVRPRRSSRRQ